MSERCHCGTDRPFEACCGPLLSGAIAPPTAEALMRSRYSAYCRGAVGWLHDTSTAEIQRSFSRQEVAAWARAATFTGLRVLAVEGGGVGDEAGTVDFSASYIERGEPRVLRERSAFVREEGLWRYAGGTRGETVRRETAKVGRNDPCPCGSGRKAKKCCGGA